MDSETRNTSDKLVGSNVNELIQDNKLMQDLNYKSLVDHTQKVHEEFSKALNNNSTYLTPEDENHLVNLFQEIFMDIARLYLLLEDPRKIDPDFKNILSFIVHHALHLAEMHPKVLIENFYDKWRKEHSSITTTGKNEQFLRITQKIFTELRDASSTKLPEHKGRILMAANQQKKENEDIYLKMQQGITDEPEIETFKRSQDLLLMLLAECELKAMLLLPKIKLLLRKTKQQKITEANQKKIQEITQNPFYQIYNQEEDADEVRFYKDLEIFNEEFDELVEIYVLTKDVEGKVETQDTTIQNILNLLINTLKIYFEKYPDIDTKAALKKVGFKNKQQQDKARKTLKSFIDKNVKSSHQTTRELAQFLKHIISN